MMSSCGTCEGKRELGRLTKLTASAPIRAAALAETVPALEELRWDQTQRKGPSVRIRWLPLALAVRDLLLLPPQRRPLAAPLCIAWEGGCSGFDIPVYLHKYELIWAIFVKKSRYIEDL